MWKFLRHLFFPHDSNNQRAKFLHPSSLVLTIGFFVGFQLLLNQLASNYPQILGYASQISPEEIIRLTNLQRTTAGLSEVKLDTQLSAAAAQKAADMFARNYWAHTSPIGIQPWNFISQAGYSYRYAGENLARDFSDAKSVVDAWVASPTHRKNLLNSSYRDIGIAVVDGTLEGRETTLVVQMFGAKPSAAPAVNSISTSIVKTVHAATSPSTLNSEPKTISPFDVTKAVSLTLLIVFVVVLVMDIVAVYQKKVIRWTSKSFAHLLFMLALLIAAFIISKGQIL